MFNLIKLFNININFCKDKEIFFKYANPFKNFKQILMIYRLQCKEFEFSNQNWFNVLKRKITNNPMLSEALIRYYFHFMTVPTLPLRILKRIFQKIRILFLRSIYPGTIIFLHALQHHGSWMELPRRLKTQAIRTLFRLKTAQSLWIRN